MTRRQQPEASLPRKLAQGLLLSAPQRAVLFVDGDNDTYPLWFLQQVDAVRRDVTVVTVPLLGADWYGDELARRYQLLPGKGRADTPGDRPLPVIIAERAREQGRPVTASIALDRHTRDQLGRDWVQSGLVYVERPTAEADTDFARRVEVDTLATRNWAERVDQWLTSADVRGSTDTIDDYAVGLLQCPRLSLVPNPTKAQSDSLASLCNRR